jgi:putative ABC transport system permease protein
MNLVQFLSGLELGLLYSLVTLGIYLSFRVVNFADLSVDGTFPLGAAITASLLLKQYNLPFTLIIATLGGCLAGTVTGYLNTKYKIMEILAGILTMSALYSINLRLMGQPNLALMDMDFTNVTIVILLVVVTAAILLILFLKTNQGLALRVTGQNQLLAESLGINTSRMKIIGLAISNGLVALCGGLFALMQGFADISMGTGTIIIGLASLIIGEKIIKSKALSLTVISTIAGAICYRLILTTALNMEILHLEPSDLNLISSALVTIIMIMPMLIGKVRG